MLRPALVGFALLAIACGGSARRINPDLLGGPRGGEPSQGFEFSCTYVPGPRRAPAAALRLCSARRSENVDARLTDDGGLRVRIRFRDRRGHRLDLYFYRQGGRTMRGAMLVERRSADDRIEIEPDKGWIAVDHLDIRGRSAAGRYALTFGGLRIGGSFSVRRPLPNAGPPGTEPAKRPRAHRARRPRAAE